MSARRQAVVWDGRHLRHYTALAGKLDRPARNDFRRGVVRIEADIDKPARGVRPLL